MANRYFINGGVDSNWGSTSNWSTTSGGGGGSAVPLATDDVFFDANSPNCTVNASNRVALTLNFTGYTNTITMTFQISVSGNVTLKAGLLVAGSGTLSINAAATLTSNGFVWPNALTFATTGTTTLADNWVVTGLVTRSTGGNHTLNGFQITCNGGYTQSNSSTNNGTTLIVIGGGTFTGSTSSPINNSFTLNSPGTITLPSGGQIRLGTGTYTYTAGTLSFAGTHTLVITSTGATIDFAGQVWNAITTALSGSVTITLSSVLAANGLVTLANGGSVITLNGSELHCGAGLTHSGSGSTGGTTEIVITGSGTLTGASNAEFTNPLDFDCAGAAIVVSSNFLIDLGKTTITNAPASITTTALWDMGGGSAGIQSARNMNGGMLA